MGDAHDGRSHRRGERPCLDRLRRALLRLILPYYYHSRGRMESIDDVSVLNAFPPVNQPPPRSTVPVTNARQAPATADGDLSRGFHEIRDITLYYDSWELTMPSCLPRDAPNGLPMVLAIGCDVRPSTSYSIISQAQHPSATLDP